MGKTEKNSNVFRPDMKLLAFLLSVKILYCLRTYIWLLYDIPQVYGTPICAKSPPILLIRCPLQFGTE